MDILYTALWEVAKGTQNFLSLIYPPPELPDLPLLPLHPPFCFCCSRPFPQGLAYCRYCNQCMAHPRSFLFARSGYIFCGLVREVIHWVKYNQKYHLIPFLEEWLEKGYRKYLGGWNCQGVVPVPLHPSKFRQRGFNLAEELALWLCRRQNLPYFPALERIKPTKQQAALPFSERTANVRGAFRLKRGFDLKDKNLLIIDDVMTTTATAQACAEILKDNGGAKTVAVLTIARS
ncbi:ComF family protein [Candidatus Methylacidiphilum infernorum]|uniref:ComF family protein n=1 Tax=Candidatus Methylacidiphilum infernorum TaxID=511746 RepID=A0ABX7PX36_9BACT|nr:ComF family protein [Candidatus Methylacidiphilum infernorum]QSR87211.1 ComF family protein [Candidatus Methylacidiphilum infernorum]